MANVKVYQGPFFCTTLCPIYINDTLKNILRYLVTIYADDTSVCGCIAMYFL